MTTVKAILATILVPGAACLLVPYLILKGTATPILPHMGIVQLLAIPLAILGAGMVIWVSVSFVRKGGGTPIPIDPPRHLVVQGLYRYTRNPMYLGAMFILVAISIAYASVWILIYTVLLWIVLHAFTVWFEEPQLKRRFGDEYVHYLQRVPRWIPRLTRQDVG